MIVMKALVESCQKKKYFYGLVPLLRICAHLKICNILSSISILCYFIFSHQLGASVISLDLSSSTNSEILIGVFPLLLLFFLIVWNKRNSPI